MDALTELVLRYGLTFLFLSVLLEQLGAPIPAVPVMVVAGALVAEGKLSGGLVVVVALAGSLLGDAIWFRLGRVYGRRILELLCRISLSPDSCVRQTDGLFERLGLWSLVVAKFVPGLSTVAPPLAGAAGIRWGRFLLVSALGALLWVGLALLAGMVFHDAIDQLLSALANLGNRALLFLAGALVVYVLVKGWQRRRFHNALRLARISADELDGRMKGEAPPLVVDVRSAFGRAQDPRRIPGALALDLERLDEQIARLPLAQEIVLYCT